MADYLDAAGDRLEYLRIAADRAGPTIVLLHDSLGSIQTWKNFPHALAQATRLPVLAYSRAGHGASSALKSARTKNYLEHEAKVVFPALLDALKISQPILFGHSDGATIALVCAGARPDLPRAVIAEAPHVYVEPLTVKSVAAVRGAYAELRPRLAPYHRDPDALF